MESPKESKPEQKTMFDLAQERGITFKCLGCGKVIDNVKDYPCSCGKGQR